MKKFINHLWYLGDEIVCFSLFGERIDNLVKKQMADKLLEYDEFEDDEFNTEIQKKYVLKIGDVSQFLKQDLPLELWTPKSKNIFRRFHLTKHGVLISKSGKLAKHRKLYKGQEYFTLFDSHK